MDYNRVWCPYCGRELEPGSIIKITKEGNPICPNCNNLLSSKGLEEESQRATLPSPLNKFSPKVDRLYLAIPYTSEDTLLMETRYELSLFVTAILTEFGFEVYSPIVYTHVIAHRYNIKPDDSKFWVELDEGYIRHWATGFLLLTLPGHSTSSGVAREQRLVQKLNIPQAYLSMETLYDITRALPSRLD